MALAPMANVTDAAFRELITKYGRPDVMFTEFVSVDGLLSAGREKLLVDFWYEEAQRPIVAQIFGSKPENFYKVAKLIKDLKFDGIDINMGCPDRAVMKQGAGGACIKNPELAKEIIAATKEGGGGLPVSVKTRIGVSRGTLDTWLPVLAGQDLAAITVHLRTVKEMSDVPAHWELMPEIMRMVKGHLYSKGAIQQRCPLILGNGDVMSISEAEEKCALTGCDGVMLGRAIFGNPWLFSSKIPSVAEKLQVLLEHTKLFEQKFGGISAKGRSAFGGKNFEIMKKHYKAYVTGFDGAKELRMKLMEAEDALEVEYLLKRFIVTLRSVQAQGLQVGG